MNYIVELIKCCITSVDMSTGIGIRVMCFIPLEGVRQSYPISPYLFVLGMEKLSHLMVDRIESKKWNPLRVGRRGVSEWHSIVADDLLLYIL